MSKIRAQLTVYFDDPFWVGIYERSEDNMIQACRILFGSEPKDYEIYAFINRNWNQLSFSPPVPGSDFEDHRINPKRLQRQIARQLTIPGVGTKAQQALKALQENQKAERTLKARMKKEQEKDRKFELRREKQKQKHKGR
ncbi:MAG: hypothetical protein K0Q48_1845 [Bacillota bacterium]|jgi:hypothetical protein|nr:hypothetical protein [Bacillota bacterium]